MDGCWHFVGCWLLGAYIPVLIVCTQFVASGSSSSPSVPTEETAFAVCAASVLVDGVSGLWLRAIVCGLLSLALVSVFVSVALGV